MAPCYFASIVTTSVPALASDPMGSAQVSLAAAVEVTIPIVSVVIPVSAFLVIEPSLSSVGVATSAAADVSFFSVEFRVSEIFSKNSISFIVGISPPRARNFKLELKFQSLLGALNF